MQESLASTTHKNPLEALKFKDPRVDVPEKKKRKRNAPVNSQSLTTMWQGKSPPVPEVLEVGEGSNLEKRLSLELEEALEADQALEVPQGVHFFH